MGRPISLYYDLMSQPSRALWIILKMSKAPFEDYQVALRKGEHMSTEFKTINRFQKVPCIDDNGFKLAESIAILRYLSQKGIISSALYPTDIKEQARVDEFLEWQHLTLRLGCALFFREKVLEPSLSGQQPKAEKIKKLKQTMEGNLDIFEKIWLEKGNYLSGDRLTAADIFAACEIEQTRGAGYDASDKYPKLKAWIGKVRKETGPHYEAAHKYLNKLVSAQAKAKL
ncbi:glutathione S-transferase theta-1-like [Eupeodes corollae]|uniref:glutathione S-transferase theta-1-like n=1 Tax=Eupeodes corollae TaxID=290404 RepID=UPI00248FEA47|nr:glutathione S-transferase theta-1-like [Eupeodes corollae]